MMDLLHHSSRSRPHHRATIHRQHSHRTKAHGIHSHRMTRRSDLSNSHPSSCRSSLKSLLPLRRQHFQHAFLPRQSSGGPTNGF